MVLRQSVLPERQFGHVVEGDEEWGRGRFVEVYASDCKGDGVSASEGRVAWRFEGVFFVLFFKIVFGDELRLM
jgi:hypothetical protein